MTRVFDAYAAYYDLLYQDKDYAGEAEYVRGMLAQQGVSGGTILELGCGTGRHAEQFARMGFAVHGVDLSPGMVEAAQKRIPDDLLDSLAFQVGDVRTVRVGKTFDAVVSLFHVASYQTRNEDIMAMLATAAHHLKSGGVFVFDFWYGPGVLTDPPVVRVKRLENDYVEILRIAEPVLRPDDNVVDVHYTVMITERKTNGLTKIQEKHAMRYFFGPELHFLLQANQLQIALQTEWMAGEMKEKTWLGTIAARKNC